MTALQVVLNCEVFDINRSKDGYSEVDEHDNRVGKRWILLWKGEMIAKKHIASNVW